MPPSDYTSAGGGLKLKGGAGIDKKKKKKKPKPTEGSTSQNLTTTAETTKSSSGEASKDAPTESRRTQSRSITPERAEKEIRGTGGRRKTEAEKRYDEMRRKRLDERLKREGVKTHKERVEELNKYLSGLSEHHDMPKIGPG
ncbi:DUF1754-domain-containing protein [Aaosphaeria arxii CBS 175.79]|uniref:DUF1754-domain-containing protein n=1 Tax=Aaosphaeria arxii CBS 175.79 TaxID=1450172 RepID=A0A6A5XNZ6_9PLEO|nr:DUF1754-domain-containing protein [Aaosphaeria arxii CBS 175.79]KAF2014968.1 DUF1754-domain-containing protein [Aaosphaeria arxii CBS 175.79]